MKVLTLAVAASLLTGGVAAAKAHKRRQPADAPVQAALPGNPNGAWIIEAVATVGDCALLIPTALTVADNKIADATGGRVSSWGYVDENGNIVARFTGDGGRVARFHGALKGSRGSGAWSSSTDMCGGVWRAEREKAALSAPLPRLADEGGAPIRQP
jgi:hypothetical protein